MDNNHFRQSVDSANPPHPIRIFFRFAFTFALLTALIVFWTDASTTFNAKQGEAFLDKHPQSVEDLQHIQDKVQELLPKLKAATVGIQSGGGSGSGVIVSKDGYVLTAAHVIRKPGTELRVVMPDSTVLRARALGIGQHDAGLAKIVEEGEYPYVEMGVSSELKLGQWCVTLGHPGGFNPRRGEVLRVGRVVMNEPSVVWTDCKLLPGDSGGPLFDMQGRVIGIHSRITNIPFAGGVEGNFHVPVDIFSAHFDTLKTGKRIHSPSDKPYLGVMLGQERDKPEVVIEEVTPRTAASKAGLEPGDIITHFEGRPVTNLDALIEGIAGTRPEDQVSFGIIRNEQRLMVDVIMGYKTTTDNDINITNHKYLKLDSDQRTNGKQLKAAFRSLTNKVRDAVAEVKVKGKTVAHATVIDANGYLLTKASELVQDDADAGAIVCQFPNGKSLLAEIVAVDRVTDLAMLRVADKNLQAVNFAKAIPNALGQWLLTTTAQRTKDMLGVLSTPARKLQSKGVLGIIIEDAVRPVKGVLVSRMTNDSGAQKAGMKRGDIITHLEQHRTETRFELIDRLADYGPGHIVNVKVVRDGEELEFDVELMDRDEMFPAGPSMFDRIRRVSGPVSKRRNGFSLILQHDAPLHPSQCGTPLLNLKGEVVGINIARVNRSETYALPATIIKDTIAKLMAEAKSKDKVKVDIIRNDS